MASEEDLEDLKAIMEEQGLTVDVKREADGQVRVDVVGFDPTIAPAYTDVAVANTELRKMKPDA